MRLENTFTIPAGIDEAWEAFNDPRQVAPCFPGATLQSYQGDSFTGTVKVKLGPISLTYKGKGTFVERDDAAHKVVIDASGRDSHGNGTASAKVTGTLTSGGDAQTTVTMVTDLTVTGRPAQFVRGVMADVSDKLIGQFSSCLAHRLGTPAASGSPASGASEGAPALSGGSSKAPAGSVAATGPAGAVAVAPVASPSTNGAAPKLVSAPRSTRSEADAIDLLAIEGASVAKRVAPVLLGLLVLLVVLRRIRGRIRGRSGLEGRQR